MSDKASSRYGDPMTIVRRTPSHERLWPGMEAWIADTFGGIAEALPLTFHQVSMAIGEPVAATCSFGRVLEPRMQVPGDIDIVPAGTRAVWRDEGPTSVLVVRLAPSLMASTAEAMDMDIARLEVLPQMQLRDPRIEHIAWALKAEIENPEPFDRLYAESLGVSLATQLLRSYSTRRSRSRFGALSKQRLGALVEYIHGHLREDLTLAELSSIAGVSPSRLKGEFRRETGLPVHQYVIRARVQRAIELLRRSDDSLAEIARTAGFANQGHMTRLMKRVAGFTPRDILS